MIKVFMKSYYFDAKGVYADGKVTVLKGSTIKKEFGEYRHGKRVKALRDENVSDCKVKKDVELASPSAAAQFVAGYSINGLKAWKVDDGRSLKEFLEEQG